MIEEALIGLGTGLFGSLVINWVWNWHRNSDIRELGNELALMQDRIFALEQTIKSYKSAEVRAARDEQMQAVMAQLPDLMKDGKLDMEKVKAVAAANPEIAAYFAKKLLKGVI